MTFEPNNGIVIEVLSGWVAVQSDAGKAVVGQLVPDYHVAIVVCAWH